MQNFTNHNVDSKDTQSKSCELNFLWGKMRTAAWETAPQIALIECFKEAVEEGQYKRFCKGSSVLSSINFIKGFLLVKRSWCHHEGIFVVVQLLSCVRLFVAPWTAACQAPLSITISWSLFRFMVTELVMLSNHLILCHPLLLWSSISPSIRVFSNESALCIRGPKYWNLKHQSFQWIFRVDFLQGLISLHSKRVSRVFSSPTIWKH